MMNPVNSKQKTENRECVLHSRVSTPYPLPPITSSASPRGFALLIAVIFSSLALAIGLSLGSLAYRQIILSSAAADSGPAFYAADSGLECALYWDQQQNAFDFSSPYPNITCGGQALTVTNVAALTTSATSTVTFHWPLDSGSRCADVTISKSSTGKTMLYSVGHNTCDTTSTRLIERGIKSFY